MYIYIYTHYVYVCVYIYIYIYIDTHIVKHAYTCLLMYNDEVETVSMQPISNVVAGYTYHIITACTNCGHRRHNRARLRPPWPRRAYHFKFTHLVDTTWLRATHLSLSLSIYIYIYI